MASHVSHVVHAVTDRHPHLLLLPGIERVVDGEPGLAHLLVRRFHLSAHLGAELVAQLRELLEVGARLIDLYAQLGARFLALCPHRAEGLALHALSLLPQLSLLRVDFEFLVHLPKAAPPAPSFWPPPPHPTPSQHPRPAPPRTPFLSVSF